MRSIRTDDSRASESLRRRVYGKPRERVEVSQPQTVADVEKLTLAEIVSSAL